jgi:hypothetical protein
MNSKEIAAEYLKGTDISFQEAQVLLSEISDSETKYTLKEGVLVMYSLVAEYNIRSNQGVTRYSLFTSTEEAEGFLSTLKSRDGKWEWGRVIKVGYFVEIVTQDYKGDYMKVSYMLSDGEICDLLQVAAEKLLTEAVELPVMYVWEGKVFESVPPVAHPADVAIVRGRDAAELEAAKQRTRIALGTWGD